jgi:quinol monooxygenase YgiN
MVTPLCPVRRLPAMLRRGTKPMTVEYIHYKLKNHKAEELVAAYSAASEHLRAAPECRSFELTQCEEDANTFILRIVWTSERDHLDGFRKGPHFGPFLSAIRPFIGEIEEMRHYGSTGVAWPD